MDKNQKAVLHDFKNIFYFFLILLTNFFTAIAIKPQIITKANKPSAFNINHKINIFSPFGYKKAPRLTLSANSNKIGGTVEAPAFLAR